ncbi:thiopeptide-type bacteriocin biosynthesis domain-containing protein [Chitinophaga eiseniae]|uniref:Thiopeptide-type bacteriocin biosynthesis domain-containing protein n=1 Tax=Chitinophaga eiseniae TaxID=634771 RepID=A0A1T4MF28_9BACT|nr:thiopeptide-type bacteriocin biosynthesis protein [Chitinophaga eiseniae]SJZ65467.1 thiopeptide-type bacteriocin biosynthesis domain-containing protein [Chitinophaga eiseniae]
MESNWLSVHLFHAADLNRLLQLLVGPVVQQTGCPYFFIRYREGGQHIRLRLHVAPGSLTEIRRLLQDAAQAYFTAYPSCREKAFPTQQLQPNDTLQYIPYVRETSRYGNEQTMPLAEQQFGFSSAYVLKEINRIDPSSALMHAIRLNVITLQALRETPEHTLNICRRFIQGWLPRLYAPQEDRAQQEAYFLQRMEERFAFYAPALTRAATELWNGNVPETLQAFAAGNSHVFAQYKQLGIQQEQLGVIARSFLHMGHNRLGVANHDEAYIMYFTCKCLEHIYGIR